jgi:radical SAM superfamily enzyme YgiQ (UPF0313 family)
MALSAALKQAGHTVEMILDPGLDDLLGFIDLPFLKRFTKDEDFVERVRTVAPDLIAFSAMTNMYPFVSEKAALIKRNSKVPIVVGGVHPTVLPEYVLQNENIDMICRGEGDEAFVELVGKMEQGEDFYGTENFWFKRNGTVVRNPLRPLIHDLDSLPFPDRDMFFRRGAYAKALYFMAGRGCPFSCAYCCHHAYQKMYSGLGRYVRFRSPENVIQELELCKERYAVKAMYSMDDTFTLNERWLEEFCDLYGGRIGLPLYCHVRPGTVNEHMLACLKRAGCDLVFYGIDVGDPHTRKELMHRNMDDELIYQTARQLHEAGIRFTSSAIFGFPGETEAQMMRTFKLVAELDSDYAYSYVFYPFPGTESFAYAKSVGVLDAAAEEAVKKGTGSYHKRSLLHSDSADTIEVLKNSLALYVKFPIFRPLINLVIRRKWKCVSRALFLVTSPFTHAQFGRAKLAEAANRLVKLLLGGKPFKGETASSGSSGQ